MTYPVDNVLSLSQSAEILHRDGAAYPECVEITAKGHAVEAIEASPVYPSLIPASNPGSWERSYI